MKIRLGRAVLILRHREAVAAWHTWRERSRAFAGERAQLTLAVAALQQRSLAAAWRSWQEHAATNAALIAHCAHAAAAMHHRALFAAWNTWREQTAWMGKMRVRLSQAVGVMQQWRLSAVWHSWQGHTGTRREGLALYSRALGFMQHRSISAAWLSWAEYAATRQELRIRLSRALSFLRHRTLAGAWLGWREHAATNTDLRIRLSGAVRYMQHRGMAAAWAAWRQAAAAGPLKRANAQKAVAAMIRSYLAAAWRVGLLSTVLLCCPAHHCFVTHIASGTSLAEQAYICNVNAWGPQVLSVQAWQLATEEGPVCRAQAATALARMRHRYLAPAWVSWQQRRAAAARKRSLLATAVLRLQQRSMRAAWAAWQVTIRGYLIILTSLATLLCCWHLVYWISGWDQPVRGQHEGRRHIFAGCRGAQAQPAGCRRIFNSQAVELEPGSRLVRVEGCLRFKAAETATTRAGGRLVQKREPHGCLCGLERHGTRPAAGCFPNAGGRHILPEPQAACCLEHLAGGEADCLAWKITT